MIKLSKVFSFPVSGEDIQGTQVYYDQSSSQRQIDDAIAHAINHVEIMVDALKKARQVFHTNGLCESEEYKSIAAALKSYEEPGA